MSAPVFSAPNGAHDGAAGSPLRDHRADGPKLRSSHFELFGWTIDADNPMDYGVVAREDNLHADGIGIGGGPDTVMGDMVLDKFADPEGHVIGLIASAS